MSDDYILIKYKYEMGGYDLDEVIQLVEKNIITEDEFKKLSDEIQKLSDEFIKKIDTVLDVKEKEIMKV